MAPVLSRNQRRFARELVRQTGLHPHLVGAWIVAEQPAGAQFPVGHRDQNWLNIGLTDTRWYDGASSWTDPVEAARRTAAWLQGREAVPGFGKAASGIVNFSRTAGKSLQEQIAALQKSGWASSGYPNLPQLVQQFGGRFGIGRIAGGATTGNPDTGGLLSERTRYEFDSQGYDEARRLSVLRRIIAESPSPFHDRQRRSPLLKILPGEDPDPEDYMSAVSELRRMAGGLKINTPEVGAVGRMPRGGGYAGTEAIVKRLGDPIAKRFGVTASNYKRDPHRNAAVGGSPTSDHLTTNTSAFAADYPITGEAGTKLAFSLAKRLGIKNYQPGTYTAYPVKIGRRQFRVQILWGVQGHHDHVHLGVRAA